MNTLKTLILSSTMAASTCLFAQKAPAKKDATPSKEVTLVDQAQAQKIRGLEEMREQFERDFKEVGKGPFDRLRQRMEDGKVILESGTNIGGGVSSFDLDLQWCRSRVTYLEDKRTKTSLYLINSNNYYKASMKLIVAMKKAYEYQKSVNRHSFTEKALERGLLMASKLGIPSPTEDYIGLRDQYQLLDSYLYFVINTVAKKLDIEVFIPYLKNPKQFDITYFEKNFVNYAQEQMNWVVDNLTYMGKSVNGFEAMPVGPAANFLQVAEIMALSTANDLLSSIWKYRFSCAIEKLFYTFENARNYNNGDRDELINDRYAVQFVRNDFKDVAQTLAKKDSCQ